MNIDNALIAEVNNEDPAFNLIKRKEMPALYRFSKRGIDIVGGAVGLLLSLPILLVFIILIKRESEGSAIFKQQRIGLAGETFTIYKLRGMFIDAKERFPELYDYSDKKNLDFLFHMQHDPRITKVGRFIRRTSIDELPNFYNVLKGDMSLVGPRPEIPEVINLYGKDKAKYLSIKPGISCESKAGKRDKSTKAHTLQLDLDYIDNMSLSRDFSILYKTVKSVIARRNVYV